MKYTKMGEFEELVLLVVGALDGEAYGVSIRKMLKQHTGRNPSIGALHSALNRLEEKGLIDSDEYGATAERGGRRKRFFKINPAGKNVLRRAFELRSELIYSIPGMNLTNTNS